LANLYLHVTLGFAPASINVLTKFVAGDEQQLLTTVELFRQAPISLVLDRLELTTQMLERAEGFGSACESAVHSMGSCFWAYAAAHLVNPTPKTFRFETGARMLSPGFCAAALVTAFCLMPSAKPRGISVSPY